MSKFKVIAISLMAIFLLSANHGFSAENVHPHHVALFVGGAYNTEAEIDKGTAQSKLFFALGLDYEYRLPFIKHLFGITVLGDMTFSDPKVILVGGGLVIHPWAGLKFLAVPGVEYQKGPGTHFAFRAGVGYDIHIGKVLSLTPIVNFDIVNGHVAEVFGLGIGAGF